MPVNLRQLTFLITLQIIHSEAYIGQSKVESAAAACHSYVTLFWLPVYSKNVCHAIITSVHAVILKELTYFGMSVELALNCYPDNIFLHV